MRMYRPKEMSQMLQAYEGYLEKGRFYPIGAPVSIQGRCRVIVMVLDGPAHEKRDTWAELDRIVSEMDEKPRLEDFPRCQMGREIIKFADVCEVLGIINSRDAIKPLDDDEKMTVDNSDSHSGQCGANYLPSVSTYFSS